jgi:tetratricopeptide (TPR) repeat protein
VRLRTWQFHALISSVIMVGLGYFMGCAQMVWVKSGASQQDFSQDRYTCLQEAQQPASSAAVNRYGGYADSGIQTNWNLFNACMNAKGWYLQTQQRSTASAPKSVVDFVNQATSLCNHRNCPDPQKAIEYLNEAIRLKPDYEVAYFHRGNIHLNLKQNQLAIKDYDEAILLNPRYVPAYRQRGYLYISTGNREEGCRSLKSACELEYCEEYNQAKQKGYCQ